MATLPSSRLQSIVIITLFYSLIIVSVSRPSSCQQLDCVELLSYQLTYLLSIEQEVTNGLRITATPESRQPNENSLVYNNVISWPEPMSWLIPNVSLSPECGPGYFRCREVFVETSKDGFDSTKVVFVPLESGMLLLNMLYNINNLTMEWQSFFVNSFDCSPTVVYKADNNLFTVCISSVNNYSAVYEIRCQVHWNGSLIVHESDVEFVGPLTRVSITNLAESCLSNFVLKLSSQEHKVFFAIDSSIYVMDVLNPSQTKQFPELPECDRVHSLTSVPDGQLLLAYCSDRYFYYDTSYGDWTKKQIYSGHGIPYLCPNGIYNTIVNDTQRSLQFSVANSNIRIIDNVTFTSGVCFEVGKTTYFVWSDKQQNTISVFDFVTQTHYPVASYECLSTRRFQLLLLANQYIVYDDGYTTYVLNADTNFSLIFNTSRSDSTSGVSDILTTVLNISVPFYYFYTCNRTTTAAADVSTSPVSYIFSMATTTVSSVTDNNDTFRTMFDTNTGSVFITSTIFTTSANFNTTTYTSANTMCTTSTNLNTMFTTSTNLNTIFTSSTNLNTIFTTSANTMLTFTTSTNTIFTNSTNLNTIITTTNLNTIFTTSTNTKFTTSSTNTIFTTSTNTIFTTSTNTIFTTSTNTIFTTSTNTIFTTRTNTLLPTSTGTTFTTVNHNHLNIIIPTVSVIAGILVSITVAMSIIMFLRKRRNRYNTIIIILLSVYTCH